MTIEKINYLGWANSYRINNGEIELVVSGDFGPRVIHAGFPSGQNHFHVFEETRGRVAQGPGWSPYGGHRLWHAPEDPVRTYQPDNIPPQIEELSANALVARRHESDTNIGVEMEVRLVEGKPAAVVTHRLTNTGLWPIELAPWSLSMMAQGGVCIVPLPERRPHGNDLLPTGSLVMWPYTFMNDPRWSWGKEFVMLRQDPAATAAQKAGLQVHEGWAAYANHGELFIDFFDYKPEARYPDLNSNFETFTNADMLEVESLGPVVNLQPGATVEHVERWVLVKGIARPENEEAVIRDIRPAVEQARTAVESGS